MTTYDRKEELMKKLDVGRFGNGTQTYNDGVLTLTKEETLELLKHIEQLEKELKQTKLNFKNSQTHSKNCYKKLKEKFERGKEVYHRNYELIQENGKLKQENQELKEQVDYYKKEMESEQCFRENLQIDLIEFVGAIKILKDFFIIHQKNSDYLITATGFDKLSQMDYELLKRVFESVGEE